jgi:hypothetical protein
MFKESIYIYVSALLLMFQNPNKSINLKPFNLRRRAHYAVLAFFTEVVVGEFVSSFCDIKQDNSVDGFAPLRVSGLCVVHNCVIILSDAISSAA